MSSYQWGFKEALAEELKAIPTDETTENGQGAAMEFLLGGINQLEDDLVIMQHQENKNFHKLAGLQGGDGEKPAKVLQTYMVPLQEVRKDLEAWREAMMDEYRSLVKTEVVKPIDECDLAAVPGIEDAEYAPGKLVTTIKAPTGRKRARAVICGNLLTDGNGKVARNSADKTENYAGGIDGTALSCVLRKGAHEQWSLATVDVKCAFLLSRKPGGLSSQGFWWRLGLCWFKEPCTAWIPVRQTGQRSETKG